MERKRRPFQGVTNVIRFNWHFYVLAVIAVALAAAGGIYYNSYIFLLICLLGIIPISASLFVSFYVYDFSGLYKLDWLNDVDISNDGNIITINAGFDETSELLLSKYPNSDLKAFDFYDPARQTEVSIERARRAYPPYKNTTKTTISDLPLQDGFADNIFVIFAAHEIRTDREKLVFFKELDRVLKASGNIIVTEHLRDLPNMLAYNIGAFHFFPRPVWIDTFEKAGVRLDREIKITPFVTTFILKKNGIAS